MFQLRCPHKLHGVLEVDGTLRVKCDSRFCGHRRGNVVIHSFSSTTGELISTKKYKDTPVIQSGQKKGKNNG